ncbi:MAG: CBS domain-containing protein [Candidatus Aenigmatarchaeota archaeon]
MLVNEIMNRNVVVVKKDATIKEASEVMSKLDISSLVVVEGDKIVGILLDLLHKINNLKAHLLKK